MGHLPVAVANELIELHPGVDHMKLQKLLYFANGWWLAFNGEPLVSENPQVWRYGPVFRWVYNAFSRFGRGQIATGMPPHPFTQEVARVEPESRERIHQLLNWVWDEHGAKTAMQLSDETHAIGTPWRQIAETHNFRVPSGTEIPPKLDWEYFSQLARTRGYEPSPFKD